MDYTKTIIITTINKKTNAISDFEKLLKGWHIILVGDKKSHHIEDTSSLTYLSLKKQNELGFVLNELLPYNHYVRKNLGYLFALKNGALSIYDTDDDNAPYKEWSFPSFEIKNTLSINGSKYYNVYNNFTDELVWPRGFPLSLISRKQEFSQTIGDHSVGIWQGLADKDPDVDAIHRLVFDKEIVFDKNPPLVLAQGCYCPFNSQNTLWHREMIPYAYLPATVTFRFTDILRGYIAQRCIWEHGKILGFTQATVYQNRNEHDLMKDFNSEIPCYTEIEKVVGILDSLSLKNDFENNLITIYNALFKHNIVKELELDLVNRWIMDLKKVL